MGCDARFQDGQSICVSVQIPRVGQTVLVTGAAGSDVSLVQVGVLQLPKNATVEVDLIASVQ